MESSGNFGKINLAMSENNRKLRCGVVGVGYLGQHHARIYSQLDSTTLVGVYDSNPERAKEIASLYGCKVFDSVEQAGDECDAVSVVVPTDRHTEVALPLFERNCDLLIEKPICTSIEDAEKIVRIAKEKNLIVQVGHIEHFNPVMEFMEEHFSEPLGVADFAQVAGLSESRFAANFKAETGEAPMHCLNAIRLGRAQGLLLNGGSVEEASRASGFSSVQYFCRVFRRSIGMTPGEFRKTPFSHRRQG